jgi:histidine triad (HIT) family protein
MAMEACRFCHIQQGLLATPGGPIYEDEWIYAHHAAFGKEPFYLGHVLLETRRHTPDFADLTDAEAGAVGLCIAHLSHALKVCTGAEKVYAVFYGEVVPHLHIHLTARYPDTPPQYVRWKLEEWPDGPRGGANDVAALCEKLRATLREAAP